MTGKRRYCGQTLPELLRQLIAASASTITRLDFPSGDSMTTVGWYGHLETPDIAPTSGYARGFLHLVNSTVRSKKLCLLFGGGVRMCDAAFERIQQRLHQDTTMSVG